MHGFQRTFSLVPRLFTLSMIQKRIVKPAVHALNTQYSRARPTRIIGKLLICFDFDCVMFMHRNIVRSPNLFNVMLHLECVELRVTGDRKLALACVIPT